MLKGEKKGKIKDSFIAFRLENNLLVKIKELSHKGDGEGNISWTIRRIIREYLENK